MASELNVVIAIGARDARRDAYCVGVSGGTRDIQAICSY